MWPPTGDRLPTAFPIIVFICVGLLIMTALWDLHTPNDDDNDEKDDIRNGHNNHAIIFIIPENKTFDTTTTSINEKNNEGECKPECDCSIPRLSCSVAATTTTSVINSNDNDNDNNNNCCCPCPDSTPLLLSSHNLTCVSECPIMDTLSNNKDNDPSECSSLYTYPYTLSHGQSIIIDETIISSPIQNTRIAIAPCMMTTNNNVIHLPENDPYSVIIHFYVSKTLVNKLNDKTSCDVTTDNSNNLPPLYVWFATSPIYGHAYITRAFPTGCLTFPNTNVIIIYYAARLRGLKPSTTYAYEIGLLSTTASSSSSSPNKITKPIQKTFKTAPSNQETSLSSPPSTILVVGDTHVKAAKSVFVSMTKHLHTSSLLLFAGDTTYATNTGSCYGAGFGISDVNDGCSWMCQVPKCGFSDRVAQDTYKRGKDWEDMISQVGFGGKIIWMTTPGNHDNEASWFFTYRPTMNSTALNVWKEEIKLPFFLQPFLSPIQQQQDQQQQQLYLQNQLIQYMRQPIYYSFNYGQFIHVISISTEDNPINAYERWDGQPLSPLLQQRFEEKYGEQSLQYKWLERDLLLASSTTKRPWIIVMTHRPMYHTASHHAMCRAGGDWYGCKFRQIYEPLLLKYKVNLYFAGHSHHYQRSFPIKENKRDDDKGIIHIIVGTGGYDVTGNHWTETPNWIAHREGSEFGYGKFLVYNSTHLGWEFIRSKDDVILDKSIIVNNHVDNIRY
jgi:hypothetical protein